MKFASLLSSPRRRGSIGLLIGSLVVSAPAFSAPRFSAAMQLDYQGKHPEEFTAQQERVRLLVRQAQLEVSSRLGLVAYREGFSCPLTIRFEDSAPSGIEFALAYVRLLTSPKGFQQELVVNLDETSRYTGDFDPIFYHEMTHAVLNDAIGGEASSRIPPWVQEGLAVFVAGNGMNIVTHSAQKFRKSQVQALLFDLEAPYHPAAYAQYFLAIQYMDEKHSINSVQAFVRNLMAGQTVTAALEDAAGLPWAKFKEEVAAYSLDVLKDKARPDF
jgi:hypothetical protein